MYGIPTEIGESCRESKKSVKERLRKAKSDLNFLSDILYRVDMNYDSRHQAIGAMFMEVKRLKQQLSAYDKK